MTAKLLSFVIPAYNEEDSVDKLFEALTRLFAELAPKYDCEAVIVENGSHDRTYEKLLAIHAQDARFKVLKLARNFKTDGGMTAGLHYARGDAAILMCADLEDPPEMVPVFLQKWEEGYHNVYGVIKRRQGTWLRKLNSKIFYWLINKLTHGLIPRNASDFRLIDRRLYKVLNTLQERNRLLRGIVAWTGFKSIGVPFNRGTREAGISKAYTLHVIQLAIRGILSFSYVPLRAAFLLGILLAAGSFVAIGIIILKYLFWGAPVRGYSSTLCLILMLFGFVFMILGIMSEYIAMIFEEVKGRPNFIVEDEVGFKPALPGRGEA